MVEPKKRKITKSDWDKVEKYVSGEFEARKTSKFRKSHEQIWKEVDRQIKMEPLKKMGTDGREVKNTWHSALELGELSKASEILTSDVMRIIFSNQWFQPHVELPFPLDPETGKPKIDSAKQKVADGLLRSLMIQQHKDFGLKARFRLSVKESLHHGSFVAEVRFEEEMMVRDGDRVRTMGSPVWVPYSMWNAYPDPSPAIVGTNTFYTGAMILVEYLPLGKLKRRAKGEGWIQERLKKVESRGKSGDSETDDVELIKFKGDISIDRSDGDIFLPNSEVILANGKLVYYSANELPYPNVIFSGYERQDVRDPYYTSPIIKLSPTQKMTTLVANKFIDATALKVEPPIEYDSNDPDYAANDGPEIMPGAKSGTRSMGQGFKTLDIGDPRFALDAFSMGLRQLQEGLGVSSNRAGVRDSDRETATSANLANQGAEVRTIEFVSQLEPQGLLPFLYMQHELNRMKMKEYSFYNDEMHTPDFIRATKNDIQANAHFEIVGSKGLLGEEQRRQRLAQSVAFFSQNPLFAPKLKTEQIMLDELRDAGKKNPEDWVKTGDAGPQIPPQVQQQMQEMQQALQKLGQENQQLKSGAQVKMAELQMKAKESEAELKIKAAELQIKQAESAQNAKSNQISVVLDSKELEQKAKSEREQLQADVAIQMAKIQADYAASMEKLRVMAEIQEKKYNESKKSKRKIKAPSGAVYEIEES